MATSTELTYLRKFDVVNGNIEIFIDKIIHLWDQTCGSVKRRGCWFELHTGGWSDNEEIMGNISKNHMFWYMYWHKSVRGGHYYFKIKNKTKKRSIG